MKKKWNLMTKPIVLTLLLTLFFSACTETENRDIYQLKIYTLENESQELRMDNFLKEAYIPAVKRTGIANVGVFKPVEEDTLAGNLIYVLIPFSSISDFENLEFMLHEDLEYQEDGKDYIDAEHDDPPYKRIESIIMRSFETSPEYGIPTHATPVKERVYELRSYEGATEKRYEKKVEMLNVGLAKLFVDLDFQPIFFGEVLSGREMPNLMYLTTFKSKESQLEHWDAFREAPLWLKLKADEQYKNTVSKIHKHFLYPTEYSDL